MNILSIIVFCVVLIGVHASTINNFKQKKITGDFVEGEILSIGIYEYFASLKKFPRSQVYQKCQN